MKKISFVIIILITLFAMTCRKIYQPSDPISVGHEYEEETITETINPGTATKLEFNDGTVVDIPSNALSTSTDITIKTVSPYFKPAEDNTTDIIQQGYSYSMILQCEPDGLEFDEPITLTIPYLEERLLSSDNLNDLVIITWNGADWDTLETHLNSFDKTLSSQTTHFSEYRIAINSSSGNITILRPVLGYNYNSGNVTLGIKSAKARLIIGIYIVDVIKALLEKVPWYETWLDIRLYRDRLGPYNEYIAGKQIYKTIIYSSDIYNNGKTIIAGNNYNNKNIYEWDDWARHPKSGIKKDPYAILLEYEDLFKIDDGGGPDKYVRAAVEVDFDGDKNVTNTKYHRYESESLSDGDVQEWLTNSILSKDNLPLEFIELTKLDTTEEYYLVIEFKMPKYNQGTGKLTTKNFTTDDIDKALELNEPPVVTITSPPDDHEEIYDETIQFRGSANDPEQGAITGDNLVWSSNIDGFMGTSGALNWDKLSVATHRVYLTAYDNTGIGTGIWVQVTIKPKVTINSPTNNQVFQGGKNISLKGTVAGIKSSNISNSNFIWKSDIQGIIGYGANTTANVLNVGKHKITLSYTAPNDNVGETSITIDVVNQKPVAEIELPANNSEWKKGKIIAFSGKGTDLEDGTLPKANFSWASSIHGTFVTGESQFNESDLAVGTHIITLTVKDSQGATDTDQHTISITDNQSPTVDITNPLNNASYNEGTDINFICTATDPDGSLSSSDIVWKSNKDGDFGTGTNFFYSDLTANTHTITVTATDNDGDTNTDQITVYIAEPGNTAPTASFTVSPTSGTTSTTFNFDASGSSDNEDATSALQVRWDWTNNGSYDTNWSTTKTATHKYSAVGTYTVKLEVKDTGGLTDTYTKTVSVGQSNTAPTASFTVSPTSGTTSTTFSFDASGSSDNEDATSALQVRWDWTNNGSYDTNWSTTKTATHKYSSAGTYTVKLEVKDTGGLTNTYTKNVNVENADVPSGSIDDSFDTNDGSWTEYDPDSKIVLDYNNDQRLEFTDWKRYDEGFVQQSITPISNFTLEYDINITADGGNANQVGPSIADSYGSTTDIMNAYKNAIFLMYYAGHNQGGSAIYIYAIENGVRTTDTQPGGDYINISMNQTYYVKFEKDGDNLTLNIYSDQGRTNHILGSPVSATSNFGSTTFNNFYAVNSFVASSTGNWEWTSGWIDNIKLYQNSGGGTGTVTDIDGNVYNTIQIGNQEWMAENLKVTRYRNGEAIPNVTGNTEWTNLSTGAYCSYNNDNSNVATYGLLYSWYAVDESRGLAPSGWHIPTDEEWKQLEMYLGMSQSEADVTGYRGTDEGGKLKETGTTHWYSPNEGATNSSGFTALPGGYRSYDYGTFYGMGGYTLFWAATEGSSVFAWYRALSYNYSGVSRNYHSTPYGFSVRCVRD